MKLRKTTSLQVLCYLKRISGQSHDVVDSLLVQYRDDHISADHRIKREKEVDRR